MRNSIILTVFILLISTSAFAKPPTSSSVGVGCNWGQLTAYSILENDFEQGKHSSDPSGDGKGKEDRVGLANVINRGDMQALCEFIEDLVMVSTSDPEEVLLSAMSMECNWGRLTMQMILENDFEQGKHASDPSGDGKGKEDRVGLANVVEQGDLQSLCMLIDGIVNP